jgi:ABC-2 type transport system ATP-binding protein
VRDVILKERAGGRTIFFSTHILSDVETMCDHVTILRQGSVVVTGEIHALLRKDVQRIEVTVSGPTDAFEAWCTSQGHGVRRAAGRLSIEVMGEERIAEVVRKALDEGLTLAEVVRRTETLEDLFVREAIASGDTTGS